MPQPVTVIAVLKARAGKEQALAEALAALVEPSRADPGCINYDMHRSSTEAGLFMFHENWDSKALLDAHLDTPHLRAFFARADELLERPTDLTLWQSYGS